MTDRDQTIAVLGGTGKEGGALAARWARAGFAVVIGSREREKAIAAAAAIAERTGSARVSGTDLVDAAARGSIVVLTVPYAAQLPTLTAVSAQLAGKILVDVTVPLVPPKVARVQLPQGGSAAVRAQALLGPDVRVVSAFQNISHDRLEVLDGPVECDVLVTGDDKQAREAVIELAVAAGMRAWHAGALCNSAAAEALTSVLIFMNIHYKAHGAGIQMVGLRAA
jgi:NADPH-dependent F420 reductase